MRTKPEIVRVWGRADSFEVEFTRKTGTIEWLCSVPPDTSDGIYAVEIWARNELGQTVYYTGELYMCGGICHIRLNKEPYQFVFSPALYAFRIMPERYTFKARRCEHL